MKTCAACKAEKPTSEYFKDSRASDGLRSSCRECDSAQRRHRYATDPEYRRSELARFSSRDRRDRIRQRYASDLVYRARIREAMRRSRAGKSKAARESLRARSPEKHRAGVKLREAVRSGKIIKPSICERCQQRKPLHGHHDDYTKWDCVRWLCANCHSDVHNG
jgi:hypothetical protein